MKKSIIAAGAASVALAAMPIVSTFALTSTSVTDTINASITDGCIVLDAADKNVTIAVAPNSTATSNVAESISVVCNATSWKITAVGAGEGTHPTSLYNSDATPAEIATGTSGTNSYWSFKVDNTLTTGGTVADDFKSMHVIPADAANGIIVTGSAAAEAQVYTQYQVFASTSQAPGTYTGKVTYTVSKVTTP